MKSGLNKQQRESLDNKIVFVSSAMFLYAMLLMFIQKMSTDPITVNGALAFIEILRWVALVGAMGCAAWSAYKEKRSFFVYCAMCLFIFLSTTVLKFCTQKSSDFAYVINYGALIVLFVLTQVFRALKVSGALDNKKIRIAFTVVCAVIAVAFAAFSAININSLFLPEFLIELQAKLLSF